MWRKEELWSKTCKVCAPWPHEVLRWYMALETDRYDLGLVAGLHRTGTHSVDVVAYITCQPNVICYHPLHYSYSPHPHQVGFPSLGQVTRRHIIKGRFTLVYFASVGERSRKMSS